jgi:hypothetical protein
VIEEVPATRTCEQNMYGALLGGVDHIGYKVVVFGRITELINRLRHYRPPLRL